MSSLEFPSDSQIVVSSDGVKIYADAVGNPDKPSIVFVHGQGLSSVVFDNVFSDPGFNKKFYLVRYDMRGHGQSDKPDTIEGYGSKAYADDFSAVATAFKLHKPLFVGWSLGATVFCDIAQHLPSDFCSGAVYLAGLPYIGPIMGRVATPQVLSYLPGLFSEDVTVSNQTLVAFSESLFSRPENIPWKLKCEWIGMSVFQLPKHRRMVLERPQDPAKLFELGKSGFPLLVLGGTHDKQVVSSAVKLDMEMHFKNMDVDLIEGGSHALHVDNLQDVLRSITKFALKAGGDLKV